MEEMEKKRGGGGIEQWKEGAKYHMNIIIERKAIN